MQNIKRLMMSAGLTLVAGAAFAVDGDMNVSGGQWNNHRWNLTSMWDLDTIAGDGGVAVFSGSGSWNVDPQKDPKHEDCFLQDIKSLSLSGWDIGLIFTNQRGEDITMVGAKPYISSSYNGQGSAISLLLKGTGSNTLVKRGSGGLVINRPVENFAAFEISAGKLYVTNAASPVVAAGSIPVVLGGGCLAYAPNRTAGETASATVSNLTVDTGLQKLTLEKGNATSATLEIYNLKRNSGGILDVVPSAIANLGSSEKIMFGESAAETALDVTRIVRNGNEVGFLAYDEDNGLVPSTTTIPEYAAGSSITAATTKPVVKVRGNLTATEPLRLGDENTPGAMVVGTNSDASGSSFTVKGDIDFPCEGVVYRPASTKGETKLYFLPDSLTATGGISFVSKRASGTRAIVYVSTNKEAIVRTTDKPAPGWTIPVRLNGVRLANVRSSTFGEGAEIWVGDHDGISSSYMSILNQHKNGNSNIPDEMLYHKYDLHLCGVGLGSGYGAVQHLDSFWQNSYWRHTGRVFLHEDSWINQNSSNVSCFRGPISGVGGLTIENGFLELLGTNTFSGTLKTYNAVNVSVKNGGTLGAGKLEFADGSRLVFTDRTESLVVSNKISMAGSRLVVQNSNIELTGDTTVKTIVVQQNGNLGIGATLTASAAELDGNAGMTATDKDGTFVLGANDSTTNRIAAVLSDGSKGGKLSFTKDGSNTVEIFGKNTYTGKTTVKGGTLRLASNLWDIPDLSYWCDADDDSTITTNANGEITEWRSKVGNFKFVRPANNVSESANANIKKIAYPSAKAHYPHYSTATFNGHKSIRFRGMDGDTNLQERLAGDRECQQRTIFIVARSIYAYYSQTAGSIFGTDSKDQFARTSSSGSFAVNTTDSGSQATSAGYGYQNGVYATTLNSNYEQRANDETTTPNVMTLLRPRDVLTGFYTLYTSFKPAIGGAPSDGRAWGGDYCEIIAFSRTLTDPERKTVENYLMKKWNPDKLSKYYHSDAECTIPEARDLLPTGTDLELHTGAVVDLNGVSQTVRSLVGEGTLINSSDKEAMLTITAGGDFHGTIRGNIKVVRTRSAVEGADNVALLIRDGGTFVAEGSGKTTFSAYNPYPVTNSIAFWLDASYNPETTIITNAEGSVTKWICRQAGPKVTHFGPYSTRPTGQYSATAFANVKPGVRLDNTQSTMTAKDKNNADAAQTVRTLFIVAYNRRDASATDRRYTFGPWGIDSGIQITPQSGDATAAASYTGYLHYGDTVRLNGVDYSSVKPFVAQTVSNPYVLSLRINDSHAKYSTGNFKDVVWTLGNYASWTAPGADVSFGEVIAYTNSLSDYEYKLVDNYLMRKWVRSGASWPVDETQAFDSTCGLGVSGGAQIDFAGADLTLASVAGSGGGFTNFKTLTVTGSIDLMLNDENRINTLEIGSADSKVTFGTAANNYTIPVYLQNASSINRQYRRQNAVKVTGTLEQGSLEFTEELDGWQFMFQSGDNPLWYFLRNGAMLLVR